MRSVPAGSFQRLTELGALRCAWLRCRQGKRRRAAIAAFDLEWDRALLGLQRELRSGAYRPSPWRLHSIRDPKPRLIAAPAVRDRVVHHALLAEIGPTYERGFIHHHYATGAGRGPHRAVLQYLAWMRRFDYRLHLDIAGYFASIAHARLIDDLFRRLRDPQTRRLAERIVGSGDAVYQHPLARQVLGARVPPPGYGLPLGSWFSQWSGAFYLDPMDQLVVRTLKPAAYLRYMDDFVLFADAPGPLADARGALVDWLAQRRALALNPGRLAVEPNRSPGVFLGYRVSRAGIAPSRKLRRRLKGRLRQGAAAGPETLVRSIRSYRGLLCFPDV